MELRFEQLLDRLSDAWAWLESHALIGFSSRNPQGSWYRVTAAGAEVVSDPNAIAKVWAGERLAGALHPALSSARTNFALGEYESASFSAMKSVEVEVRRASGLPEELLGVPLMRKAFSPKDGVLRDPGAEGAVGGSDRCGGRLLELELDELGLGELGGSVQVWSARGGSVSTSWSPAAPAGWWTEVVSHSSSWS